MPFPGSRTAEARVAPSEEVVATLVRWSLHTGIGNRQPPDELWPRILARVREMESPEAIRPQPKRLVPMAPLLQVVLVGAVLMTVGLGLQRTVPRASIANRTVRSTEEARQGYPEDALRTYLLIKLQRAAPVRRFGGQSET